MKDEIAKALGIIPEDNEPELITFGQVIFFDTHWDKETKTGTITECGRTAVLPFMVALDIYAETPNPASQILKWHTEEQRIAVHAQLQKDIKDPKWLKELFDCI